MGLSSVFEQTVALILTFLCERVCVCAQARENTVQFFRMERNGCVFCIYMRVMCGVVCNYKTSSKQDYHLINSSSTTAKKKNICKNSKDLQPAQERAGIVCAQLINQINKSKRARRPARRGVAAVRSRWHRCADVCTEPCHYYAFQLILLIIIIR